MTFHIRFVIAVALIGWLQSEATLASDKKTEQTPAAPVNADPVRKGATVFGFSAGYGFAHEIAHSDPDHQFVSLGGRVGRILTEPWGPGFLKGHLEFFFEALPLFLHYDDKPTYGSSFTLMLRHYFSPASRWRPFMTLGAGALVTTSRVPEGTTRYNFTPQGGLGLAIAYSKRTAFSIEYRYHHISNADTVDLNPGINSSSIHFGVSIFR
jgi:hypothetical protein